MIIYAGYNVSYLDMLSPITSLLLLISGLHTYWAVEQLMHEKKEGQEKKKRYTQYAKFYTRNEYENELTLKNFEGRDGSILNLRRRC